MPQPSRGSARASVQVSFKDGKLQPDHSQIVIQPGFLWDAQDAYLFDIDGTILRDPNRVHMDSIAASIGRVTGFEVTLAGVPVHGSTDTAILSEACRQAGIPPPVFEAQVQAILLAMCENVASRRAEIQPILMPGIEEALRYLAQRGALLGVATGNLEAIGWIKIEEAGLREWFHFGGFSDRFPIRSELVAHAAAKARELKGPSAAVCVVGDTPRDIEAAHANSLPVIAVATGHFSCGELLEYHPEACVSSLAHLLASTRSPQ